MRKQSSKNMLNSKSRNRAEKEVRYCRNERREQPLIKNKAPAGGNIPPPAGYASWLECVLDCLNVRSLERGALFREKSASDREAMRCVARQELEVLRDKAATLDHSLRVGRHARISSCLRPLFSCFGLHQAVLRNVERNGAGNPYA